MRITLLTNREISEWFYIVLGWTVFFNLYSATTLGMMGAFIQILEIEEMVQKNDVANYFYSPYQYIETTLFGFLFGSLFFIINYATDKTGLAKKSFGKIIFIKSLLYFFAFIIVIVSIFIIMHSLGVYPKNIINLLLEQTMSLILMMTSFILVLFFILLTNFMIQVNKKFGQGNLWRLFLGKYHQPVVENRIFMFLDLKASTTYAEQLGHIKYSQLIQDCFHDLNKIVAKYKAEIYQYVGDEAVLTWKVNQGLSEANCIQIYFSFKEKIHQRANYYLRKYQLIPEFKAWINSGDVTVTEVGDIKREIAYHGDVLNTAARIQGVCNHYQKKMLISENLCKQISFCDELYIELIGEVPLKGKKSKVKIYSIEKNDLK